MVLSCPTSTLNPRFVQWPSSNSISKSTMTGFARAKEDRPTPPEVYNWRVYASALIISMGVMAYGYDSAFIGTTITQASFKRDFTEMTKAEQDNVDSNLTSICG